jgi:hypothetical protein
MVPRDEARCCWKWPNRSLRAGVPVARGPSKEQEAWLVTFFSDHSVFKVVSEIK